jgi:pimeloyl-ACP methyl ester carboxylesterase
VDAGFCVVRYSHRDTGLSTHIDTPYDIDELLLDLRALISVFGDAPVHLVGHSMGGYLAQMASCRFPGIVASVTSISAGSAVAPELFAELSMSGPSEATWEVLMKNQPSGDFLKDLPGWLESWRYLNGTRKFDEELATAYTRSLYVGDPRNAQVATNHIHAMSTVPVALVKELRTVRCPFLVIHGSEDPLVPLDNGEATARLAPVSRFVRLERAGHMFFSSDSWTEIHDVLVAYLKRHS